MLAHRTRVQVSNAVRTVNKNPLSKILSPFQSICRSVSLREKIKGLLFPIGDLDRQRYYAADLSPKFHWLF